jgi:hypothetical protein
MVKSPFKLRSGNSPLKQDKLVHGFMKEKGKLKKIDTSNRANAFFGNISDNFIQRSDTSKTDKGFDRMPEIIIPDSSHAIKPNIDFQKQFPGSKDRMPKFPL